MWYRMYKKFSSASKPVDSFSAWRPLYRFDQHPDMFVVFSVLQCAVLRLFFHNKFFSLFLVCPCCSSSSFQLTASSEDFFPPKPGPKSLWYVGTVRHIFIFLVCMSSRIMGKRNHSAKIYVIYEDKKPGNNSPPRNYTRTARK